MAVANEQNRLIFPVVGSPRQLHVIFNFFYGQSLESTAVHVLIFGQNKEALY